MGKYLKNKLKKQNKLKLFKKKNKVHQNKSIRKIWVNNKNNNKSINQIVVTNIRKITFGYQMLKKPNQKFHRQKILENNKKKAELFYRTTTTARTTTKAKIN